MSPALLTPSIATARPATLPLGWPQDDKAAAQAPRFSLAFLARELPPLAKMAADFLLCAAAMTATYQLGPWSGELESSARHLSIAPAALGFGFTAVIAAQMTGLSAPVRTLGVGLFVRCLVAACLGLAALVLLASFLLFSGIGRGVLAAAAFAGTAALWLPRALAVRAAERDTERIGLAGTLDFLLSAGPLDGQRDAATLVQTYPAGEQTAPRDLARWAHATGLDVVVFQDEPPAPVSRALIEVMKEGLPVRAYSDFVSHRRGAVPLEAVSEHWWLAGGVGGMNPAYAAAKRCLDVLLATAGLAISAPFVLLAAAAIRLESRGPAFYTQRRVGLRGQVFDICKLRTMRSDAEAAGVQWTRAGDSRITRIGRLLRKVRLDEAPQFWNILRGEMSFTGPRPERPEMVRDYGARFPFYHLRHLVRPGLTGWAQVNDASAAGPMAGESDKLAFEREKLSFDLYYLKHASLELDLDIILRTFGAIMRGAR